MISKLKALCLAFVAVAAMSMAVASAAQATELHATVKEKAVITGHQHGAQLHTFQITPAAGPSVKCAQSTFESTVVNAGPSQTQTTVDELTLTPTYSGCQAFGQAATVKMNGCKYTITGTHIDSPSGQVTTFSKTAWVDISGCTVGKQIEVQSPICQIKVPEQNTLSHIVFANVAGTPHDVTATVTITGISYQVSGVGCGHTTGVTTNDGTYHGFVTLQAYKDLGNEQKEEHGHLTTKYKHDNVPVGLEVT